VPVESTQDIKVVKRLRNFEPLVEDYYHFNNINISTSTNIKTSMMMKGTLFFVWLFGGLLAPHSGITLVSAQTYSCPGITANPVVVAGKLTQTNMSAL
jgi:hypothetical protein